MDQFTYANLLQQMKTLANEYSGLPTSAILGAYSRAMANNPWIQNKRVRQINTLPAEEPPAACAVNLYVDGQYLSSAVIKLEAQA